MFDNIASPTAISGEIVTAGVEKCLQLRVAGRWGDNGAFS